MEELDKKYMKARKEEPDFKKFNKLEEERDAAIDKYYEKPTIKGRAKTTEEKLDEFSKKINKEKQNSPVYALDRATMYMDDKYGKNWDKNKTYKLKTERAKQKIKGVGKTAGMKQADKEWKKEYNKAVQQWNQDTEKGANDPNVHYKEFAKIMDKATKKMGKTMDKMDTKKKKAYSYKRKK